MKTQTISSVNVVEKVMSLLRRNHKKAAHEAAIEEVRCGHAVGHSPADIVAEAKENLAWEAYNAPKASAAREAYRLAREEQAVHADEVRKNLAVAAAATDGAVMTALHKGAVKYAEIKFPAPKLVAKTTAKTVAVLTAELAAKAALRFFVAMGCKALTTKAAPDTERKELDIKSVYTLNDAAVVATLRRMQEVHAAKVRKGLAEAAETTDWIVDEASQEGAMKRAAYKPSNGLAVAKMEAANEQLADLRKLGRFHAFTGGTTAPVAPQYPTVEVATATAKELADLFVNANVVTAPKMAVGFVRMIMKYRKSHSISGMMDLAKAGLTKNVINKLEASKLCKFANVQFGKVAVDVNKASLDELVQINSIGNVFATAIVTDRRAHGAFASVEDMVSRVRLGNGHKLSAKAMKQGNYVPVVTEIPTKPMTDEEYFLALLSRGNHEHNALVDKKVKEKEFSTISLQKISFVIDTKALLGFRAVLDVENQPYSLFNRGYARPANDVRLYDRFGHQVYGKPERMATDKAAVFDLSGLMDTTHVFADVALKITSMRNTILGGAVVDGKAAALIVLYDRADGRRDVVVTDGLGRGFSLMMQHEDGRFYTYKNVYRDRCVAVFDPRGLVYSTSAGRKNAHVCYDIHDEESYETYKARLHEATFGESTLADGRKTDTTGLIDLTVRESSHTTAMSALFEQGVALDSVAMLFEKDSQMDGQGHADATGLADALKPLFSKMRMSNHLLATYLWGLQLQIRPFTAKATVVAEATSYVRNIMTRQHLYTAIVIFGSKNGEGRIVDADGHDITEVLQNEVRLHFVKNFDKEANDFDESKALGLKEKGYTGIQLCYISEEDYKSGKTPAALRRGTPAIIGDRNFWKDEWELTFRSGLNVLAIAHVDENNEYNARTANQMLKVLAYAAQQAGAMDEFYRIYCNYAKRAIDELTTFSDGKPARKQHFGEIDTTYITPMLRQLNKDQLWLYPTLMKGIIADTANAIQRAINLDRMPLDGHAGMFSTDPAYALLIAEQTKDENGKERARYTEADAMHLGVIDLVNGVMEVYDPWINHQYDEEGKDDAERTGIVVKYPSMGIFEMLRVRYVSDREVAKRVAAMDLDFDKKIILIQEYAHAKYGTVMLPANLEVIAWIVAGSDRDGDKGIFIRKTDWEFDIVAALERWGMFQPLAVDIDQPDAGEDAHKEATIDSYAFGSAKIHQIALDNDSVGIITNANMTAIQPPLYSFNRQLKNTEIRKTFVKVFRKAFKGDGEAMQNYRSIFNVEQRDGHCYVKALDDAAEKFSKSLHVALDGSLDEAWATCVEMAKDFGIFGRIVQEGTIDAAKKFYKVVSFVLSNLRRLIKQTRTTYATLFEIDWTAVQAGAQYHLKADHSYDNSVVSVKYKGQELLDENNNTPGFNGCMAEDVISIQYESQNGTRKTVYRVPDFMTPARNWVIKHALARLNKMVEEYRKALIDPKAKMIRQGRFIRACQEIGVDENNTKLQAAINEANHMASIIRGQYRTRRAALYGEQQKKRDEMSDREQLKADEAIRRQLHQEFDDMFSLVDNMLRIAFQKFGKNAVSPVTLINYLNGDNEKSATLIGMLKPETAYAAIAQSADNRAYEPIRGNAPIGVENKIAEVRDGNVVINGELTGDRVYAEDGTYELYHEVDTETGEVSSFITRPLTDFITLPEADMNERAIIIKSNIVYVEDTDGNGFSTNKDGSLKVNKEAQNANHALVDELNHHVGDYARVTVVRDSKRFMNFYLNVSADDGSVVPYAMYQRKDQFAAMNPLYTGFYGVLEAVLTPADYQGVIVVVRK